MFHLLYSWPDELPSNTTHKSLDYVASQIRLHKFDVAESLLLSKLKFSSLHDLSQFPSCDFNVRVLLFWLYRTQGLYSKSSFFLNDLDTLPESSPSLVCFLRIIHLLDIHDYTSLAQLSAREWRLNDLSSPFLLLYAEFLFRKGEYSRSKDCINSLPSPWSLSAEVCILTSKLLSIEFNFDTALSILLQANKRFPSHLLLQCTLLVSTIQARSYTHTIPALRSAISLHGEHSHFLSHLCSIALLQNRTADARRYVLKDRLIKLSNTPNLPPFLTNLWITQERLGYTDWLKYSSLDISQLSSLPQGMLEPLLVQNESINGNSQLTQSLLKSITTFFDTTIAQSNFSQPLSISSDAPSRLTVAWLSADIAHHPVARFIYGFFANSPNLIHNHILVDLNHHGSESALDHFDSLANIDTFNVGPGSLSQRVDKIRDLKPDIAIDLNGWTGGHFLNGFHVGLAPIQINYLGYFSTTGIPKINYWLGDTSLFSNSFDQWHTESLYRLKRCFIAWQPVDPLPEASLSVPVSSASDGVAFGSFNNNRKLSDSTLKLWGDILSAVPHSTLVLKASNKDDFSTQEILRRRMLRQNLDVSRVIWLPRAQSPLDHLNQYSLIDISLDCFPNGGCTTTCESLWMGVPVITLSGCTYVSRMSTAVLSGASLQEWVVSSEIDYLKLAISQASNLTWLRQNRDHWRHALQTNPLGNACNLMDHLEQSFIDMFAASL